MENKEQKGLSRLRIAGFFEGISLILLVFVAVPLKHFFHEPALVKILGPVHGALFVLFVFQVLSVSLEQRWRFSEITWKLLLASFVPFGTFYANRKLLKSLQTPEIDKP